MYGHEGCVAGERLPDWVAEAGGIRAELYRAVHVFGVERGAGTDGDAEFYGGDFIADDDTIAGAECLIWKRSSRLPLTHHRLDLIQHGKDAEAVW